MNAGAPIGDFHDEDPFRQVIQFLKKRLWIVGVAVLLGFLGGVVVNHFSQRLFTAQANIEVESEDMSSQFRLEQMQGGAGEDTSEKLDTEIEILHSRNLALETIKELHLESNPDFVGLDNGKPWDMSKPSIREMLIANFRGSIKISRLGHTNIVQIFATNKNPELASLMANTLIDRYIEHSFRENYAATAKISTWLDEKLNGLRTNLEKSQAHILDLQKDIGVLYGIDQSHSVVAANLEELNKQYADAQVDRLLKESRLQEIRSSSPDVIDAAIGATDPLLAGGRSRLAQLNTEYTSLVQTYGSAYPRVKTLKAQIDELQQELEREEKAQVSRAEKEFDAAENNESKLLSALGKQEQDAYGMGEKAMEYELARRDYETNRLLYDGLQQRLQEASIMSGLHSTAIHTVDSADTPVAPSRPRTSFNRAVGMALGFVIGVVIALFLEALDTNLKTMSEIEQALQLPLLAAIPEVEAENLLPSKFREHAVTPGASSWSKVAEALRGMRTSILLSSPGAPPKVIMIASTRPAEGKSSVAGLTAITFALNGAKVLLVDARSAPSGDSSQIQDGQGTGSFICALQQVHFGRSRGAMARSAPNVHISNT